MDQKLKVGILGATGMVGQRFISLLENHPWFEVVTVAASPRSAGKTYEEAVGGRWKMQTPMPEKVKKLVVMNVNEVEKVASGVDFVFSAVDMTKEEIRQIEDAYAKTETPVVSNNSAHRWTPDVPHGGAGDQCGTLLLSLSISGSVWERKEDSWLSSQTARFRATLRCLRRGRNMSLMRWWLLRIRRSRGQAKTFKDWPEMEGNIIPYIARGRRKK